MSSRTCTTNRPAEQAAGCGRQSLRCVCVRCASRSSRVQAIIARDECHDLNAEKLQRVKCFVFTICGICACRQFSKCRRGRPGSKISGDGRSAEATVCFAMSGLPPISRHQSVGSARSLRAFFKNSHGPIRAFPEVRRMIGPRTAPSSSLRKQGPITTGRGYRAKAVQRRLSKQATRRMGPCFRRDDGRIF